MRVSRKRKNSQNARVLDEFEFVSSYSSQLPIRSEHAGDGKETQLKLRASIQRCIRELNHLDDQIQKNPKPLLCQMLQSLKSARTVCTEISENLPCLVLPRIVVNRDKVLFNKWLRNHVFSYLMTNEREDFGWHCCKSLRLCYIRNEVFSFSLHRKLECYMAVPPRFALSLKCLVPKNDKNDKEEVFSSVCVTRSERTGAKIAGFCCNDLYLVFLYSSLAKTNKKKRYMSSWERENWNSEPFLKKKTSFSSSFLEWTLEIRSSFGNLHPFKCIDLMAVLGQNVCLDKTVLLTTSHVAIQIGQGSHEVLFALVGGNEGMRGRIFGFSARTTMLLFSLDPAFFQVSSLATGKKCSCGEIVDINPHLHETDNSISSFMDFDISVAIDKNIRLLVLVWPGCVYELTFPSLRVRLAYCSLCQIEVWPQKMKNFYPTRICVSKNGNCLALSYGADNSKATFQFCILIQRSDFQEQQENFCFAQHTFFFQQLKVAVFPHKLGLKHKNKIKKVFWVDRYLVMQTNENFLVLSTRAILNAKLKLEQYYNKHRQFRLLFRSCESFWIYRTDIFSVQFFCNSTSSFVPTMAICVEKKTYLVKLPGCLEWKNFLKSHCFGFNNHTLFVGWREEKKGSIPPNQPPNQSEFHFCAFEFLKPLYLSSQKRLYECGSKTKGKQNGWIQNKPMTYLEVDSLTTMRKKQEKERQEMEKEKKIPTFLKSRPTSIVKYLLHEKGENKFKNVKKKNQKQDRPISFCAIGQQFKLISANQPKGINLNRTIRAGPGYWTVVK